MKTRISVATLLCAAIALPIAANNWNHIDAYLTNHVGAPDPSETSELTVPTDAALVRLAVAGDVGTGDVNADRTGAVMDTLDEQHPYDALLLLGDNIYDHGDPNNIQDRHSDRQLRATPRAIRSRSRTQRPRPRLPTHQTNQ